MQKKVKITEGDKIKSLEFKLLKSSREIAALRGENDALKTQISALNREMSEKSDYPRLLKEEEFIEQYVMSEEDIKKRIIAQYLLSLQNGSCPLSLSGRVGHSPLTPMAKPKSLAEAKKLAEIIIKN